MIQLTQMRQRIKAVATTKKITHAMRLIAMSTHTILQQKRIALDAYHQELTYLFNLLEHLSATANHAKDTKKNHDHRTLVLIVGSQKGLCGPFNTHLLRFFAQHPAPEAADYIVIGKKAVDHFKNDPRIVHRYETITSTTIATIARSITRSIAQATIPYETVLCYNNYPHSFFVQRPIVTTLTAVTPVNQESFAQSYDDYVWEQPLEELISALRNQYLQSAIEYQLFNSLLAEQAARFQSMDKATTNAKKILETMQRQYNKARQEKITKELTELIGGFKSLG